jgi:hypothetical protein
MRFDKQKAFPYPVLRPLSDDYVDCDFQSTAIFSVDAESTEVGLEIIYATSSHEIVDEIGKGRAEYSSIISCRDTYFRRISRSKEPKQVVNFPSGMLRGEVKIESYVVVNEEIASYKSPDINSEFGKGPFAFSAGDILAEDDAQVFYIDRDLFKPVTSVFNLVKKDSLSGAEWTINPDEEHIQIEVSPEMKDKIDNARNDPKNKVILLNSIYFAAVMQAVQWLKDNAEQFEDKKWAQVMLKQAHNKGIDLANHEAFIAAQRLMQYPISLLDAHVFKGGDL